jgi:DNA-binding CsgD family transcriptional regulator
LTHAHALADWASSEDLPLIELKALDIIAYQSRHHDPALLARAEQLARTVDQPVGPAILAHIRAMQLGTSDADSDERLLSELGIWMPLPPVSQLTGREREIALFTSLGYSSKYVAERLQLSVRTVETHLTHVYSKLGIEGREELRRWFSRGRENN